jgi:gluconate 2-dehydrogenase gamma chain
MSKDTIDRRTFLKSAVAGTAVAAAGSSLPQIAEAQQAAPAGAAAAQAQASAYSFLNLEEQAFIEAVVDHMVPADEFSPKGTDMGLAIFIDRALASGWGKGDRLYMQGPWKLGTPNQGYQLPLTPADLYRAGIQAADAHCVKTYGKTFDKITAQQRDEFLMAWRAGKVTFEGGPPARVFFNMLYQNVVQGMFSDPIYGGNRDKAGWNLIGFPGVIAVHHQNVEKYRDKQYLVKPTSISDMS